MKPAIVASLGTQASRDLPFAEQADWIELRLDLIDGDPLQVLKDIRRATSKPIIATCRWIEERGQFKGSEMERLKLLRAAGEHADYLDIELCSPIREELIKEVAQKPFIISFHDFSGMPDQQELRMLAEEMVEAGATITKIAVTPSSLRDNLEILNLLLDFGPQLCMIAMGELGRHMRAVAPLYGSVLTYGYVSQPTAPGQMSVAELREALRLLSPRISE